MLENHYKTLIIDDEAPARKRLEDVLSLFSLVEIIGSASDGIEAVEAINRLKPDLIFLDIQMPGLTGFDVLKKITHFPIVVFCTAYDDYALKAFDTDAVDYIVKPVKEDRVKRSIEKLQHLGGHSNKELVLELLEKYTQQLSPKIITSIPVKIGDRMLLIKLTDISYFISEEKYVFIVKKDGKRYLTDHPLKFFEEKLPDHFIRIHRSILVNSLLIHEINKHFGSRYIIHLDDAARSKLISGRNYCERIKSLVEL